MSDIIESFAALPAASVRQALVRLGLGGQCTGLKAVDPAAPRLCGRAFTVQYLPCSPGNDRTPEGEIGDYLQDVPEGYVVAVDNRGYLDRAVWDQLLSRNALQRRLGGTVIDGVCLEEARRDEPRYPLFTRGQSTRSAVDLVRAEAYNVPVDIGGAAVEADDVILGDADGLLVIPRGRTKLVLDTVRSLAASKK